MHIDLELHINLSNGQTLEIVLNGDHMLHAEFTPNTPTLTSADVQAIIEAFVHSQRLMKDYAA